MVEGGRLIHSLPITLIAITNYLSLDERDTFRTTFESDVINLLVDPPSLNLKNAVDPRKTRNKSACCDDLAVHPLGDAL